jgi:hypothetical protein
VRARQPLALADCLHQLISCYAVLCYAVLHGVVLHCAVLSCLADCAMLHCGVLCCAVVSCPAVCAGCCGLCVSTAACHAPALLLLSLLHLVLGPLWHLAPGLGPSPGSGSSSSNCQQEHRVRSALMPPVLLQETFCMPTTAEYERCWQAHLL